MLILLIRSILGYYSETAADVMQSVQIDEQLLFSWLDKRFPSVGVFPLDGSENDALFDAEIDSGDSELSETYVHNIII